MCKQILSLMLFLFALAYYSQRSVYTEVCFSGQTYDLLKVGDSREAINLDFVNSGLLAI